ncbi:MAG: hypothetical protein E6Q50_03465 [Lysobacter sp.]|nr:MAG: hypothetical protein E6Q50_03465 [Lysobacter sp.]
MRKFRLVPMALAVVFCANAQAHLYRTSPCGFSNFYFSRAYEQYFSPSELTAHYIEYMREHGLASCRVDNSGNPDPESCGGVDAAHFIVRFAKEQCEMKSYEMNMSLICDFSATPFLGLDGEDHHEYRFSHGLLLSCGTCAPTPMD